jgi:hypothetical protein
MPDAVIRGDAGPSLMPANSGLTVRVAGKPRQVTAAAEDDPWQCEAPHRRLIVIDDPVQSVHTAPDFPRSYRRKPAAGD